MTNSIICQILGNLPNFKLNFVKTRLYLGPLYILTDFGESIKKYDFTDHK